MSKKLVSLISIFLLLSLPQAQAENFELTIAADHEGGYERALFKIWIDADSDGCNTREEVLIQEAVVKPTIGNSCNLTGGAWLSPYDGIRTTKASALDIDHVVPLSEAWKSGAWAWTPAQRQAFANDLDDSRALVAVSLGQNRSKGDKDPAQWLPPKGVCTYIADWISIKARYQLSVDPIEAAFLTSKVKQCKSSVVTVVFNKKVTKKVTPTPTTISSPTPTGLQLFKFANCAAVKAAGVAPIRKATNPGLYELNASLDRDKDGVACDA
jgi:hypothetical protein